MSDRSLEYLPRAKKDLKRIGVRSRKMFGQTRERRTILELRRACDRLQVYPSIGKPRDELGTEIRSFVVGIHTIFYRFDDSIVSILSVRHQHQDVQDADFD